MADHKLYLGVPSGLPAWLPSVGAAGAIAGSTFNASGVGSTTFYATPYNRVLAYSGACLNTVGLYRAGSFVAGTFLVLFGGGHLDYQGNEVYAYGPLESDAPTWSRLNDPTDPAPVNQARDASGNPVSRHTYDTLVYLPTTNKMLCIGAPAAYSVANSYAAGELFDFDVDPTAVDPWTAVDTSFPTFAGAGAQNLVSGYDPNTATAYGLGTANGTAICAFDAAAETWTSASINNATRTGSLKAGYCPDDKLLVYCNASGVVYAANLSSGFPGALYSPSTTGTGPGAALVMEWDEDGGHFVGWPGTGNTFYRLTPGANPYSGGDDWAWSSVTATGDTIPAGRDVDPGSGDGTYGRFRRVTTENWAGYLVMHQHDEAIHFYRTR